MGPRARKTSPVCATTIIPSYTVAYKSIKIGLFGSWGYNHVTYARHQVHVSLVSQNTQKYATFDYCTK